ncbi:sulfhydryl oxidase 1-like isoform X3 [Helianthus annuus]|uniref:sulfhydryl oxidase 1-like isoform X3 n=1 Tax=Helianthus annuus TaxID=4232 RepID=UPI001652D206|nr:sulfhydryl oxidase 1-like isoform X3 [Helianthus annuus]XP_035843351.1 sulfhydryl oxidase 1-like isoform X3 [Helianthus annuus]
MVLILKRKKLEWFGTMKMLTKILGRNRLSNCWTILKTYWLMSELEKKVYPGQITQAVYDVEEATFIAFDMILENKQMVKPDTRGTLIKFMQLMVSHHPSRRCQRGTANILVNFDDLYLSKKNMVFWINLAYVEKKTFCRGSTNDTRGFRFGIQGRIVNITGTDDCVQVLSTFGL